MTVKTTQLKYNSTISSTKHHAAIHHNWQSRSLNLFISEPATNRNILEKLKLGNGACLLAG